MDGESQKAPGSSRTPPYIAFKTFLTLIEDLHMNGVPQQIDRSILKRFSGGVGSQLLMALRSLALIDDQGRPKPSLESLVKAHGKKDEFAVALRPALQAGFPFLSGLNLLTVTPSMFADAFKSHTDAKEDVLKKCRRFYLHAAPHADIQLGPRLSGAVPGQSSGNPESRTNGGSPVRARRYNRRSAQGNIQEMVPVQSNPQSMEGRLVDKYPSFDPSWGPEIQAAWFAGFQKLMASMRPEKKDGGQS